MGHGPLRTLETVGNQFKSVDNTALRQSSIDKNAHTETRAAAAVAQPVVAAATAAAADTRFSAKKTGTANSWQQQWN